MTGDTINTKTTSAAVNDNPKARNLKLKKAIIPKWGSAAPMSHQPAPPSLSPKLHAAIQSAEAFWELPLPYKDGKAIKKFRLTCYSGWIASSDMFDGFTIDSEILLGIIQAFFTATWPNLLYIPCQQDVFHWTVNMIVIHAFSEHHLQPL